MTTLGKGFQLVKKGELLYLQSPLLEKTGMVDHAFSLRPGGCSSGAMAALNTAFHTEDDANIVLENRRLLLAPFGYNHEEITAAIQVHGTEIIKVGSELRGRGAFPGSYLGEGDALVTDSPGTVITAYAADCQLLFLAAPRIPLVALAHAGWRGTAGNMAGKVVAYLKEHYGVEPEEITAAISPGICPHCYPLAGEGAETFRRQGWLREPYMKEAAGGSYAVDLSKINAAQLRAAGIREENLSENSWCTSCREDLFYSYRRDRGVTGRMMGFMAIRPLGKGGAD